MRIEMDTPVDALVHGDTISYIDLDEDEILHWQYIRREKLPNGKYRYYYDEKELNKYKNDAEQATANAQKAKKDLDLAQNTLYRAKQSEGKAADRYRDAVKNSKSNLLDWVRASDASTAARNSVKNAEKQLKKADKAYAKAAKNAEKLIKKYEIKKVTSFVNRTVSRGIVAVANWFNEKSGK